MRDSVFVDTNLFVYMQRDDDPVKKQISRAVLSRFTCVASTQVLNEICNIFTRKYPIPTTDIKTVIDGVRQTCEIEYVLEETIDAALELVRKYRYSYYDSLMLAAALNRTCAYIFTEDMNDGQIIEGSLKIVDIFKHQELVLPAFPN